MTPADLMCCFLWLWIPVTWFKSLLFDTRSLYSLHAYLQIWINFTFSFWIDSRTHLIFLRWRSLFRIVFISFVFIVLILALIHLELFGRDLLLALIENSSHRKRNPRKKKLAILDLSPLISYEIRAFDFAQRPAIIKCDTRLDASGRLEFSVEIL